MEEVHLRPLDMSIVLEMNALICERRQKIHYPISKRQVSPKEDIDSNRRSLKIEIIFQRMKWETEIYLFQLILLDCHPDLSITHCRTMHLMPARLSRPSNTHSIIT